MARGGTLTLPLLVCSVLAVVRAGQVVVAPAGDPQAADSASCGSRSAPCASLQHGIRRAQQNDTVQLLPGDAAPHLHPLTHDLLIPGEHLINRTESPGGVNVLGKSLQIDGGDGAAVLDCQGRGRGLVVIRPDKSGQELVVSVSGLIIQNCHVTNTGGGGGIYVTNAKLLVANSAFLHNIVTTNGAAINAVGSATDPSVNTLVQVQDTHIFNNTATQYGGGIALSGSNVATLLVNVTFEHNACGLMGGGLACADGSMVSCQQCRFAWNRVTVNEQGSGGAVSVAGGSRTIFNNTQFMYNQAALRGGAVYYNSGMQLDLLTCHLEGNTAQSR